MAKKVFLGVGHGGADSGAAANGLKEKNMNLTIALACRDELERHGVEVLVSRVADDDETLTEKIGESNAFAPDLTLDIHNNAGGGDGAEVFYSVDGSGKELAENILEAFKAIGQNSRGIKTKPNSKGLDGFIFIRNTHAPAVLVECAFIDNKTDVQIIDTEAEQQTFGVALAKGILKTLGIAWVAPSAPEKPQEPGILYRVQVGAFSKKANAERKLAAVQAAGFDAFVVCVDGKLWRVQVGAFAVRANADKMLVRLKEAGFSGFVTTNGGTAEALATPKIEKGSVVRVKAGAKTYTGGGLASFVYERNHTVKEINGDRVVITYNGVIVAAMNVNDLTLV